MSKRKLALLGNLLVIIGLSIGPMLGGVRVAFAADPSFWTITPSPNESTVANYLWGVSAVKSGCVVAVGSKSTGGLLKPAIQRWDGIQWKAVLNQPFVDGYAELNSVTSVPGHSPNTYILWAVGYKGGVSRTEDIATGVAEARAATTLIERSEDCGMNWTRDNSVDPNPNPSTGTNILRGVTAINARDVWAVGYYQGEGPSARQTLTEHWDGNQWTIFPSPNLNGENYLTGVDSVSGTKVWATGYKIDPELFTSVTLMLRWDGTQWTQEPSDNPGPNNYPLAVECRTSEDCFSVGAYQPPAVLLWTMTWQRHESGWNAVPAENQGNNWNVLHATWPVGANFAWAVGRYQIGPTNQSQIEKWDGQAWHIFPSPNPSTSNNALRGVSVVPGSCESWAVGYYVNTVVGYSQTLIERYTPAPGCTP